jgi:hypothetical protein
MTGTGRVAVRCVRDRASQSSDAFGYVGDFTFKGSLFNLRWRSPTVLWNRPPSKPPAPPSTELDQLKALA